jgi:hypothetical protein
MTTKPTAKQIRGLETDARVWKRMEAEAARASTLASERCRRAQIAVDAALREERAAAEAEAGARARYAQTVANASAASMRLSKAKYDASR